MNAYHGQLQNEFMFRKEIVPVVLIGLLLNMIPRFAVEQLPAASRMLFLDQSGTVMVAILLGPWWAAAVGIGGNIINGNVFQNYFPFGCVSVAVGVVLGYLCRLIDVRATLIDAEKSPATKHVIRTWLSLSVVAAVTAMLASLLVKMMLYEAIGRELLYGRFYATYARLLESAVGPIGNEVVELAVADLMREAIDKGSSVAIGMAFAVALGFIPKQLSDVGAGARLKTDALSMFVFALTYGLFLLTARIAVPRICIDGGYRGFEWLQSPGFIATFYAPIGLALAAFLFMAIDGRGSVGRSHAVALMRRAALYRRIDVPKDTGAKGTEASPLQQMLEKKSIYGILASVAAWPLGNASAGLPLVIGLYLVLTVVFVTFFFAQNRSLRARIRAADEKTVKLRGCLSLQRSGSTAIVERLFLEAASARWSRAGTPALNDAGVRCTYFEPGFKAGAPERTGPPPGWQLVCLDRKCVLSDDLLAMTINMARLANVRHAYVVTFHSFPMSDSIAARVANEERQGLEIALASWIDLESLLLAQDAPSGLEDTLREAAIRTRALGTRTLLSDRTIPETAEDLASRSLPTLAHMLATCAPTLNVADLGAGRGRHTLIALELGHEVLAVERNPQRAENLARFVGMSKGKDNCEISVSDFMGLEPRIDGFDVVICTGVLQHATSREDLAAQLTKLKILACAPGAMVFIEMLLEMKFDGKDPTDGRIAISVTDFEALLLEIFPASRWEVSCVHGPYRQRQDFSAGPRSFVPPSRVIESTAVEYAVISAA